MILVLLGAPGSGKGTQGDLIKKEFSAYKLSTGDILREEIAAGTALGQGVKSVIDSGHLVDDETLFKIVKDRLGGIDSNKLIIFDGYPRTLNQAKSLDSMNSHKIFLILHFDIDETYLVERLSNRMVCSGCGASVNKMQVNDGKCPNRLRILAKRPDDEGSHVHTRLDIYRKQTFPVIEWYKKRSEFIQINANASVQDVYHRVSSAIKEAMLA